MEKYRPVGTEVARWLRSAATPFFVAILLCGPTFAYEVEKTRRMGREGDIVFEKNVRVPMSDGAFVAANVFRPAAAGQYPVLLSMSVYGKDLFIGDSPQYIEGWEGMKAAIPDLCSVSSCEYHTWETPDPELWVPDGYVLIRADSRGAGKTPGFLDPMQPRETQDHYELIEWAAEQEWSNGKVGLAGISYFSINQWQVASKRPPSLAAIAPWEGASDFYRDVGRHGGIVSNVFASAWYAGQVVPVQHGNSDSPFLDLDDGSPIGGPNPLSAQELARNRSSILESILEAPLDGPYYRERSAVFSEIDLPLLTSANWGGFGLHARGNFNGFTESASRQKWLEVHGGNHRDAYYSEKGQGLLRQFYDHFLKGEDNGWNERPPVLLEVRRADGTRFDRAENEWPLARTEWTRSYLMPEGEMLIPGPAPFVSQSIYPAFSDGVTFRGLAFAEETELTGPASLRVFVSSSTTDLDLFATLLAHQPNGEVIQFVGASESAVPLSQGWLRASHRKLDEQKSTPHRPWHSHDEIRPLEPGEIYELQVEMWPMNVVLPAGAYLSLNLRGRDYSTSESGGIDTGSGPFLHTDPRDRPVHIYGGQHAILGGSDYPSSLLLPVIPAKPGS